MIVQKQCLAAWSVGLMLVLGSDVALAQLGGAPGTGAATGQPSPLIESRWQNWHSAQTGLTAGGPNGFPVGLPQVPQELPAPQAASSAPQVTDERDAATPVEQAKLDDQDTSAPEATSEAGAKPGSGSEAKKDSDEPDLAKRVEELEKILKKQADQEAKKKEEAAKKPTFKIGGRIHLDQWSFPNTSPGIGYFENPGTGVDPEDRLAFRRIRLETQGDVFETMLYRVQIDFNNPSEPEMKDVYLGFQELPYNQVVTIGHQKRPLGLDALDSSRFAVFMERPLVVDAFDEDYRRLGVLVSGNTDDELYNWQYGVFSLENVSDTGRYIGDSLQLSGNARLASVPWYDETSDGRGYFHWGIAGMLANPDGDVGPADSNENTARFRSRPELRSTNRWIDTRAIAGADWYEILGLESRMNVGSLNVTAEYETNWLQRDNTTPGTGPDLYFHGAYVGLAYFLTGEHHPIDRTSGTLQRVHPFENFFLVDRCKGGRGHGWGAWELSFRYSYLDLSDGDVFGGLEKNVTYGLNWHWTSHSKLQFNAVSGDITNHAPVGGFTAGHFTGFGTRLMVDF